MRATGVEQVVRGFTPNWMGEKGGAQSDGEEQEDVLGNPRSSRKEGRETGSPAEVPL